LDDPCAANATDDNAMRKTAANDRIRFMVYLFSLRFEDDAGFDTPITEGDSREARFIPDRRIGGAITFPRIASADGVSG
jgi:hypothetical protein